MVRKRPRPKAGTGESCMAEVTGDEVRKELLNQIGLGDMKTRVQEVVKKLRYLRLDSNEYVCLRYLILLNQDVSGLLNRQLVHNAQEKVNTALLEYCTSFYSQVHDKFGELLMQLPEIRLISMLAEDYLNTRHMSGDVLENSLLIEMLHSKRK
ncbi:Nuclear receptor subfamily 5 group A member 2 [Lamellibrachia satsuma]|nr:Nuclear receptor subfamily 5 group A member 2 [Lamellibrachia satsuma]